jgi:hypothetical protein
MFSPEAEHQRLIERGLVPDVEEGAVGNNVDEALDRARFLH